MIEQMQQQKLNDDQKFIQTKLDEIQDQQQTEFDEYIDKFDKMHVKILDAIKYSNMIFSDYNVYLTSLKQKNQYTQEIQKIN